MSLLAYLVPQKLDPEPAATLALAYILRKNELAAEFIHRLGLDLGFEFGHIESERRCEGGQPDLTVFDSEGRCRIFIENKFWAPLSANQPVQYLHALPEDLLSGLAFIVPEQQIKTVWEDLKSRSRAYEFGNELTSGGVTLLQTGTRTMCIMSWRHVLDLLKQISPNDDVKSDVLQLSGLVGFDDLDGFSPLRGEEVKQVSMPKRIVEYCKLVQPIIEELKSRHVVRDEIRLTHDWDDIGRSFCLSDRSEFWLGVALEPWANTGITPLWLRVYPGNFSNLGKNYHRLEGIFEDVRKGWNSKGYPRKYIPIRLRTGADRDDVIRDAADQVQCKLERLGKVTKATRQTGETA